MTITDKAEARRYYGVVAAASILRLEAVSTTGRRSLVSFLRRERTSINEGVDFANGEDRKQACALGAKEVHEWGSEESLM
jgi:hypothetical protein